MIKLKVFGNPCLTDTNHRKKFTTALPLLITTYIVVEHQGEAEREKVHDLFFPMTPHYPERGSESGRMIYEKLWEYGKTDQNSYILIARTELEMFSDSALEAACQELKHYHVIEENSELKNESLNCHLASSFKRYLSGFKDDDKLGIVYDGKEKKRKIHNTCLTHIGTVRTFVEESVHDKHQVAELDIM